MSDCYEKSSEGIGEELMGVGGEKSGGADREQKEQTAAPETVSPGQAPDVGPEAEQTDAGAESGPPVVPVQHQPLAGLQAQPRRPGHPRGEKPSPQGVQPALTPPTPQFPYQRSDKSPAMENYRRRMEGRSPLGDRSPPRIFGPEWPSAELGCPGPSHAAETPSLGQPPIQEEPSESLLADLLAQPADHEEKSQPRSPVQ